MGSDGITLTLWARVPLAIEPTETKDGLGFREVGRLPKLLHPKPLNPKS